MLVFPSVVQWQNLLGLSVNEGKNYHDALVAALSLGRLDVVTILLTFIGIIVGIFAIVGFGYFSIRAEKVAEETAITVALDTANKVAIDTLRELKLTERSGQIYSSIGIVDPITEGKTTINRESEMKED